MSTAYVVDALYGLIRWERAHQPLRNHENRRGRTVAVEHSRQSRAQAAVVSSPTAAVNSSSPDGRPRARCETLEADVARLKAENDLLSKQIVHYKSTISQSSWHGSCIADEELHGKMNDLFHMTRDFALSTRRLYKPVGIHFDLDAAPRLRVLLPDVTKESSATNTIITIVAHSITEWHGQRWAFGPNGGELSQLTGLAQASCSTARHARHQQWLNLTRELLRTTDASKLEKAREQGLLDALNHTRQWLTHLSDLKWTDGLDKGLGEILAKALDIIDDIQFHPATFTIEMRPASSADGQQRRRFDPAEMEDDSYQQEGLGRGVCRIRESIWPVIKKIAAEDGQKIRPVVVSKARVRTFLADSE